MAARRTEIYQPSAPPAFGDSFDFDDADLDGHRLPRLIVGVLLGLTALTTLVWLGYEHSVGRGRTEIVIIGPPPGPVRTRPEVPGGEAQPYSGLKIYEQPQPAELEAQQSRLSPVSSSETVLSAADASSGVQPQSKIVVPRGPATPEYLQIASYPSQELAEKALRNFQIEHGDLAGVFLPDIKKADLGAKGVWYRLRLGPFPGITTAAEACEKMKKEGLTCLITAR
jgi:hypothetical protein